MDLLVVFTHTLNVLAGSKDPEIYDGEIYDRYAGGSGGTINSKAKEDTNQGDPKGRKWVTSWAVKELGDHHLPLGPVAIVSRDLAH